MKQISVEINNVDVNHFSENMIALAEWSSNLTDEERDLVKSIVSQLAPKKFRVETKVVYSMDFDVEAVSEEEAVKKVNALTISNVDSFVFEEGNMQELTVLEAKQITEEGYNYKNLIQ